MKNYSKIALVLASIALICAAIIASINLLTSGKIKENEANTKASTIEVIYSDFDKDKSFEQSKEDLKALGVEADSVESAFVAKDSNDNLIGYVFTVTGKNAYGTISLMVAVEENVNGELFVHQVEFLTNDQSYSSTVAEHVKNSYHTIGKKKAVLNPYSSGEAQVIGDLSEADINDENTVNVKCGATFGATLVRTLVLDALKAAEKEAI